MSISNSEKQHHSRSTSNQPQGSSRILEGSPHHFHSGNSNSRSGNYYGPGNKGTGRELPQEVSSSSSSGSYASEDPARARASGGNANNNNTACNGNEISSRRNSRGPINKRIIAAMEAEVADGGDGAGAGTETDANSNNEGRGAKRRKNDEHYKHVFVDLHQYKTIEAIIQVTADHNELPPRSIAAVWTRLFVLAGAKDYPAKNQSERRDNNNDGQQKLPHDIHDMLDGLIQRTLDGMKEYNTAQLTQTILGIAKVIKNVRQGRGNRATSRGTASHQLLRDGLVGRDGRRKLELFEAICQIVVPRLAEFDPQGYASVSYACAAADVVPSHGGKNIFAHIADNVMRMEDLRDFEPRAISNLTWAYATARCADPRLFDKIAYELIKFRGIECFQPQHVANIVWSYTTARISDVGLFEHMASETCKLESLREYKPQELSNVVWSFAKSKMYFPALFEKVGIEIVRYRDLSTFDPQHVSNIVWAFSTAKIPDMALFDRMAGEVLRRPLKRFMPQNISNISWAFAVSGVDNRVLFDKMASEVLGRNLRSFKPQELANILWSYAKLEIPHPRMFEQIAVEIIQRGLRTFIPQDLSNILYAYAAARLPHQDLFDLMAKEVIERREMGPFAPQHTANIVWSYATAKVPCPRLFVKVADDLVAHNQLMRYSPLNISNVVWAYATAQVSHPALFDGLAGVLASKTGDIEPQVLSNTLWAYATCGHLDPRLFNAVEPRAVSFLAKCTSQEISNIAWAYAVADVDAPRLFDSTFINILHEKLVKINSLNETDLTQLYQWHLWRTVEMNAQGLPQVFHKRCYDSFTGLAPTVSTLQRSVVSGLASIGLRPKEEVVMRHGYSVDAMVEVNGRMVGIEMDGPYHFLGRKPNGSTILKRRQCVNVEGIELACIPYWDWDPKKKDHDRKRSYLRWLLRVG